MFARPIRRRTCASFCSRLESVALRVLNALLVIATLLAYVGGYLQEKKRLATTLTLPAAEARDRYERLQQRRERVLVVVTAVLVAGAVAAGIASAAS
jgi:hypothetical protein